MSLNYFNEVRDGNFVLSVDNLRINFTVDPHFKTEFENYLTSYSRTDIKEYPVCTSDFRFKYLWTITYSPECTMTVAYVFNGSNLFVDKTKGYLDFNPNKLGSNSRFWADYREIKSCCDSFECVRCDVACDIPTKREFVFLEKDNRLYTVKAYSNSNKTEYLGLRSNIGSVKLYNKTMESKLDFDLTRLEITCAFSADSFFNHFPKVWDITNCGQLTTELLELNDTDLAIIRMAIELQRSGNDYGLMTFNSIGRYKKAKLQKFVLPESALVVLSSSVLNNLFKRTRSVYGL